MRRSKRLSVLKKAALDHLERLRNDASSITLAMPIRKREIEISNVSINLLNLWSNFMKAYYLSGMLCARSESGARISVHNPGLTYNQAVGRAVLRWWPT